MKGPGLRIDLDVRRVWRCSKCGRTVRTPGLVVAQRCGCSEESRWMALIPAPRREPFHPPEREPLPESETADEGLETPSVVDVTVVVEASVVDQPLVELPVEVAQLADEQTPEPAAVPLAEPSLAEPVAVEPLPANPPPEDFGAGLENASPPPAS